MHSCRREVPGANWLGAPQQDSDDERKAVRLFEADCRVRRVRQNGSYMATHKEGIEDIRPMPPAEAASRNVALKQETSACRTHDHLHISWVELHPTETGCSFVLKP